MEAAEAEIEVVLEDQKVVDVVDLAYQVVDPEFEPHCSAEEWLKLEW